jgi:diguanylate cyclase (GGDEF)-like protein
MLTAWVICGGASLAAAAITRLAESPRAELKLALDLSTAAVLLLGISVGSVGAAGLWASDWIHRPSALGLSHGQLLQTVAGAGINVVLVLCAWGLGLMLGRSISRPVLAVALTSSVLLMPLTAWLAPHQLLEAFALGIAAGSVLMVVQVRQAVIRPKDRVTRVVGLVIVGLAVSSLLRAGWTLTYTGAPQFHMVHVPAAALPVYALFYAGMPTVLASLVLVMLNGQLLAQLRHRAAVDELTGALTRRALHEQAPAHIAHTHASRRSLAVFMLDIDHFKRVNDQHGHAVGDRVLRQVGALLREHLRPDCLLARYGGEEFVALVPVSDVQGARVAAERLRKAIADADWSTLEPSTTDINNKPGALLSPTISLGATLLPSGEALDAALLRADQALYRAKREGRNQVQMGLAAA